MAGKKHRMTCCVCYLFNKKIKTEVPVAKEFVIKPAVFHTFPARNPLRATWIKMCGLNEEVDDVSTLRVCSDHFTAADYVDLNARQFGGRIRLHANAYPTKLVPGQKFVLKKCMNTTTHTSKIGASTSVNCGDETEGTPMETAECKPLLYSKIIPTSVNQTMTLERKFALQMNPTNLLQKEKIASTECKNIPTATCIDAGTSINCGDETEVALMESTSYTGTEQNGPTTPKKKQFYTPRYIGDLVSLHVATPRMARETLKFAKDAIQKKTHEIKILKQQNRCYLKKIKRLQDVVAHLKNRNLISDEGRRPYFGNS